MIYYNFFKITTKCRTTDKWKGITRQQICFLLLIYSHLIDEDIVLSSVLSSYNMSKVLRMYYIRQCWRWIYRVKRDHYRFTDEGIELVEYFIKEYEKRASKPFAWS